MLIRGLPARSPVTWSLGKISASLSDWFCCGAVLILRLLAEPSRHFGPVRSLSLGSAIFKSNAMEAPENRYGRGTYQTWYDGAVGRCTGDVIAVRWRNLSNTEVRVQFAARKCPQETVLGYTYKRGSRSFLSFSVTAPEFWHG